MNQSPKLVDNSPHYFTKAHLMFTFTFDVIDYMDEFVTV